MQQQCIGVDPNSAWTLTNKAWSLNGLKRYEEALECSNNALELILTVHGH